MGIGGASSTTMYLAMDMDRDFNIVVGGISTDAALL